MITGYQPEGNIVHVDYTGNAKKKNGSNCSQPQLLPGILRSECDQENFIRIPFKICSPKELRCYFFLATFFLGAAFFFATFFTTFFLGAAFFTTFFATFFFAAFFAVAIR